MKYVKDREQFLKNYKSINEETSAGGGPMANDIKWGDSLLGRLINWGIRKVGIGVNMGRINLLIPQLKSQFDRILATSAIDEISDEDKLKIFKTQISALLGALKEVVYKKEKVGKIKSITDSTIEEIESLNVDEESEKSKTDILEKLEEFRKFLDQFGDDEGVGISEEGEEGEEEKEGEGESSGKGAESFSSPETYMNIVNNLKALSLMIKYYKNVKISGAAGGFKEQTQGEFYVTKAGDTIESIQKNTLVNKNKLTTDQIWTINSKILQPYLELATKKGADKNKLQLKIGIKINISKVNENYIFEATFGTGGGKDRANVKSGEDQLTQAFGKIKKDLEVLISDKEKGLGISAEFLDQITNNSKDEENRKIIRSLYSEVRRYLVGDKKATIQEKDVLFKESIDVLKDKNKKVIVAEKLARFSKRALQFDGQNLYGGLGDFGKALKQFVDTLKPILKSKEEKPEATKESFLRNYSDYVRLIREAEGDEEKTKEDEGKPKDLKTETTSDKIIDFFEKTFNFDAWVINKTEIEKISKNMDKIGEEQKSVTIDGIDPIIRIVKLFNRAYKLHTVPVIPGGRSEGKVDRATYAEYDAFGGDSMSATADGPYRNKKMFNIWENAVLDVMSERKYQPIFDAETKIRVGNKEYPKVGVALRQFMTDMLDGEELYKGDGSSDGAGSQKKFLAKYFGDIEEFKDVKGSDISEKDPETGTLDVESNAELSPKIPTPNFSFISMNNLKDSDFIKNKEFEGKLFQLKGINADGKDSIIYGFVQEQAGNDIYIVYSRTFFYFLQYCKDQVKGVPDIQAGKQGAVLDKVKGDKGIFATKMDIKSFSDMLLNRKISISSIKSEKGQINQGEKANSVDVKNTFFLGKLSDDGKVEDLFKTTDTSKLKLSIDSVGGFKDIRTLTNKKYEGDFVPVTKLQ
jgi:hypothetical protein